MKESFRLKNKESKGSLPFAQSDFRREEKEWAILSITKVKCASASDNAFCISILIDHYKYLTEYIMNGERERNFSFSNRLLSFALLVTSKLQSHYKNHRFI